MSTARWCRDMGFAQKLTRRRLTALLATAMTAVLLGAGSASAQADASIEGVWTFNGGKVAITATPGGGFVGTVVAATKFATCTHPVGEEMWTGITPQPDGSYWGGHQWFFDTEACLPNPTPGPTAWRVVQKGESQLLKVCFSKPGGPQPTIAPEGQPSNATFGCLNSALIASVPELSSTDFVRFVRWPGSKSCLNRKTLRIRILDPNNDPLEKVSFLLRSGKVQRKAKLKKYPGGYLAVLRLRGLPTARFTVTVQLTTVLGQVLNGKHHYRLCSPAKKHHRRHAR